MKKEMFNNIIAWLRKGEGHKEDFKEDFAARLNKVKSVFLQAFNEAQQLSSDLKLSISEKEKTIEAIMKDKESLDKMLTHNDRFISNLKQFIE